jgi:hypothetical protein
VSGDQLVIDTLAVRIADGGGQSHRIERITLRALERLGERLDDLDARANLKVLPASAAIDLATQSDDEAAVVIADAWLNAIALRMRG